MRIAIQEGNSMTTVAALPELGATSVEDRVLKYALDRRE